jgi:hypothetical protein
MLLNGSFTEGWRDLPPVGNLTNQEPTGWHLEWLKPGEPLYADAGSKCEGVPECVHKLSNQLPPHEQRGKPGALILKGDATYKIFHAAASFGVTLTQTVVGLEPGSEAMLTVPILLVRHSDPDPYGAESRVEVNGQGRWANAEKMGNRSWYRHKVKFTVPDDGKATLVIRVKSKWNRPKDFFIDGITLEAEKAIAQPDTEPELDSELPPTEEPAAGTVYVQIPAGLEVVRAFSDDLKSIMIVAPPSVDVTVLTAGE